MIKHSKQDWAVGQQVKVGFLANLTVVAVLLTPGDYAPDAYILTRAGVFYEFVPHNGISRLSNAEAQDRIDTANEQAIA